MNPVPHDFTKPGRLSADAQQKLARWFKASFDLLNKVWLKEVPFAVSAALGEMALCYGRAGLSKLPEGVVGYRVLIGERRAPTFLTLPRTTLLQLIGAMIGDNDAVDANREMTLIEENLADYFLVHFWLPFFREAWPRSEPATWQLQPREANPQCSRVFTDADVLIAWNWTLRGPWGESHGTWFFHKNALLEALDERDRTAPESIPEPVVAARREALVTTLPVTVEVVVGSAELTLAQLAQLQVGDVLLLDQREADAIVARTEGHELFRGKPGRLGSSKAVQIESLNPS